VAVPGTVSHRAVLPAARCLDVAAAGHHGSLCVPGTAGRPGRRIPDSALAPGSPQQLTFLPSIRRMPWPFSWSPRGRSQPVGCPSAGAVLVREGRGSVAWGLISAPLLPTAVKPLQPHHLLLEIWCCGLLLLQRGKGASRLRRVSHTCPSSD